MKISKDELCQIIDESIRIAIKDFALKEGLVTRNMYVKNAVDSLNESFKDNFKDLRNQIVSLFKNKNTQIKDALQKAIDDIKKASDLLRGQDEAQKDVQSIYNILVSLASPIMNNQQYESLQLMLKNKNISKKDLKKAIDNAINEAVEYKSIDLNESFRILNEGIGDKFMNFFNSVKKTKGVSELLVDAKKSIDSILTLLKGQAYNDMKAISDVLGAASGQFQNQQAQQQPQQQVQQQQQPQQQQQAQQPQQQAQQAQQQPPQQ